MNVSQQKQDINKSFTQNNNFQNVDNSSACNKSSQEKFSPDDKKNKKIGGVETNIQEDLQIQQTSNEEIKLTKNLNCKEELTSLNKIRNIESEADKTSSNRVFVEKTSNDVKTYQSLVKNETVEKAKEFSDENGTPIKTTWEQEKQKADKLNKTKQETDSIIKKQSEDKEKSLDNNLGSNINLKYQSKEEKLDNSSNEQYLQKNQTVAESREENYRYFILNNFF